MGRETVSVPRAAHRSDLRSGARSVHYGWYMRLRRTLCIGPAPKGPSLLRCGWAGKPCPMFARRLLGCRGTIWQRPVSDGSDIGGVADKTAPPDTIRWYANAKQPTLSPLARRRRSRSRCHRHVVAVDAAWHSTRRRTAAAIPSRPAPVVRCSSPAAGPDGCRADKAAT